MGGNVDNYTIPKAAAVTEVTGVELKDSEQLANQSRAWLGPIFAIIACVAGVRSVRFTTHQYPTFINSVANFNQEVTLGKSRPFLKESFHVHT